MPAPRWAVVAALCLASGCAARAASYRFRAPLVSSVHAAELHGPRVDSTSRDEVLATRTGGDRTASHRAGDHRWRPSYSALAVPRGTVSTPAPARMAIPSRALTTRAPNPMVGAAPRARGDDLAARLRALVGRRDDSSTHVQAALAAERELGAHLDPTLAATVDGPALRQLAEQRGAFVAAGGEGPGSPPRLGDLLVFDRTVARAPASQVGVVVSVDARDVVEFIYLARGVIRRGFMSQSRPRDKRDADGRVLNTFLRANDGGDPRGTPGLAGELCAGRIVLEQLLR